MRVRSDLIKKALGGLHYVRRALRAALIPADDLTPVLLAPLVVWTQGRHPADLLVCQHCGELLDRRAKRQQLIRLVAEQRRDFFEGVVRKVRHLHSSPIAAVLVRYLKVGRKSLLRQLHAGLQLILLAGDLHSCWHRENTEFRLRPMRAHGFGNRSGTENALVVQGEADHKRSEEHTSEL